MIELKKSSKKVQEYLDKIPLPGFEGITILNLFQFLIEVFQKGNFAIRSAAVSFRFFAAIFPTLIFLLSLIPYLPIEGVHDRILVLAGNMMPNVIYDVFESTVNELFTRKYNALLSVGFILSIYYAIMMEINILMKHMKKEFVCSLQIKNQILHIQMLDI